MSCLDTIYSQTITLFNRIPGKNGEPTTWIPTVIEGVHLIVTKSSSWNGHGGSASDDVKLNIRYKPSGNDALVRCRTSAEDETICFKKWYEPKAWRRMSEPENGLTFSFGENDDFDFFIEGVFGEFDFPISDQNFERRGFYNYMNAEYDNVFVISSVSQHDLIPHFEITAR